jgi:hypothetical protein
MNDEQKNLSQSLKQILFFAKESQKEIMKIEKNSQSELIKGSNLKMLKRLYQRLVDIEFDELLNKFNESLNKCL